MFDRTYQDVLDRWSAGDMDHATFRRQVHWYANWRYDYALYYDLLAFIRNRRIPLIGLNVPPHIPPKIAIGGIDSLSATERTYLPERIDTTRADHRAYVRQIFAHHASVPGRNDFDNFYLAQCVWEDAMAEAVAARLDGGRMIILAGNGHIIRKFGIPQRVHERTAAGYRTVYPAAAGEQVTSDYADYLWVTPSR
jgi:uncharacterized iron-regulated protein